MQSLAAPTDNAYRAILARDARFDGRLFVGVTSTGVYCRPICRVRMPRRENCRFFASAAQAEAHAFRPCMKCRPEIAPGPGLAWTVMDASRTLALQAARMIDRDAAAEDASETPRLRSLAARLGVSDRHLRRIFHAEHGVTPMQYLQTRRLLLAKQLLTDTALPVSQVAHASGFASLRRFNAAFATHYRMSPSRLRRAAQDGETTPLRVDVVLGYRTPYDIPRLTGFLAKRAIPCVEVVDALAVRRSVRAGVLAPDAGWIEARFVPERSQVQLGFSPGWAAQSAGVLAAARRWLDLDASPQTIDEALSELPGDPGLRLPGSLDTFELAVRAVLGQQVTVAAARTLALRLVERFGVSIGTPWPDVTRCFPSTQALAAATVESIAELGIIRSRAQAIIAIAHAWPTLVLPAAHEGEPQALIEQLCALPGIGPWTAHYIAMRALSWPDAFPPNDVATTKAMQRLYGGEYGGEPAKFGHKAALAASQRFSPWRSYAVLRLWNSLEIPSNA